MPTADDPRKGAVLLVGAAFWFSLMSVLVKTAGRLLPVEMLILARGVISLGLSYAVLRRLGLSPWGHDKKRLLLRGLFGLGGLASLFFAFTQLPLAEVTVIHYLNPLLTSLLAAIFLGERVTGRLLIALLVSMAGTLLVVRPSWLWSQSASTHPPLGYMAAFVGAIFSACAYVTVRRLRLTDDANVIIFYFPLIAVPASLPFAVASWTWPTPTGWLLLLAIGCVTQLGQIFLTRGLALMPAGQGTAIGYIQIAFAATWGWLFFDEAVSAPTIAGAALIIGSTVVVSRLGRSLQPKLSRT
ncbi:MAG: DMT family transporter [Myxococcota bacterium]